MSAATISSIVAITLALMPSILYATFGEIVGERAGIVNLGIEGVMLVGASCGFAVAVITGNAYLGLLGGAAAGVGFNMLVAAMVIWQRANQLAAGFAIYFLGLGMSTLIGSEYIGSNVSGLGQLDFPGLSRLPSPWDGIFRQDVLVWAMVPVAFFLWWLLFRTRWGLKLRAVGEDKKFSYAAGVHTSRIQLEALAIAGGLYGLAGAGLILAYTKTWQNSMTAGRGFIALTIVILALWNPVRAILGSLLFSGAVAVGLELQAQGLPISPFLLNMLPYLVTIAVVLAWGRPKAYTMPAGLNEVFTGTST